MTNCARPGCGHKRGSHRDVNPDAACPCPGYRTSEQQEAWEALRDNCAGVTSEWDSPKIIRRLFEVYP